MFGYGIALCFIFRERRVFRSLTPLICEGKGGLMNVNTHTAICSATRSCSIQSDSVCDVMSCICLAGRNKYHAVGRSLTCSVIEFHQNYSLYMCSLDLFPSRIEHVAYEVFRWSCVLFPKCELVALCYSVYLRIDVTSELYLMHLYTMYCVYQTFKACIRN